MSSALLTTWPRSRSRSPRRWITGRTFIPLASSSTRCSRASCLWESLPRPPARCRSMCGWTRWSSRRWRRSRSCATSRPVRSRRQSQRLRSPKAEEPGARPDAEALEREILARDYDLNIGSCLRRGWALVRSDFWPLVGVTALVLVLWGAAGSVGKVSRSSSSTEISAWALGWLLCAPLMGGLYFHFLNKIRGGRVRTETAFSGFSNSFLQLVLAGLVSEVLTALGLVCCLLPGIYLSVAWFLTLPLVIDKRLDFWPAMRVSRKTISRHWWKFLGFLLMLGLVNLAGLMACGIGVFITIPVSLAALMYAYEDIFNPPGWPAGPPAQSGLPGAESRWQAGVAAPPHGLGSRLIVFPAGFGFVSSGE